jgi:proline iminopeptidase
MRPDPMEYRLAYPEIQPYASGRLKVSEVHELYYEECGNRNGRPVVIVHGGPGGGCNNSLRRLHDPSAYRIILFDQRGCGRSTPYACLDDNTTWDLVEDMEKLRAHLGIEKWQLLGGSWGSTLSLAYAQSYPEKVSELVLRGIFTIRKSEIDWFYQSGCDLLFADAWEKFLAPIPENERHDMVGAYYRRLTSDEPQVQRTAARAWSQWEGSTISLLPNANRIARFGSDRFAIAFARIECHYFINGGFMESDDQLLANMDKIQHIPGVIVQGRYDVVTPMKTAWQLSKAWPQADLKIIPDAGHATTEPGIIDALVTATDGFVTK